MNSLHKQRFSQSEGIHTLPLCCMKFNIQLCVSRSRLLLRNCVYKRTIQERRQGWHTLVPSPGQVRCLFHSQQAGEGWRCLHTWKRWRSAWLGTDFSLRRCKLQGFRLRSFAWLSWRNCFTQSSWTLFLNLQNSEATAKSKGTWDLRNCNTLKNVVWVLPSLQECWFLCWARYLHGSAHYNFLYSHSLIYFTLFSLMNVGSGHIHQYLFKNIYSFS